MKLNASLLKKLAVATVATVAMTAGMSAAQAYTVDTLLGSTDLSNHGDATELAWAQSVVGSSVTLAQDAKVNATSATANFVSGQWVINVAPATPGYFLLDFGTGGTGTSIDTYLFKNIGELSLLVFTNSQVNFLSGGCRSESCNIGRLSHYVTYNGGSNNGGGSNGNVPEPGTVALLGLGLFGASLARRKAARGATK